MKEKKEKKRTKKNNKEKNLLKKTWYFLWYDESLLSFLANLIIAFILIKFVFYPLIGLLLGTNYPVVAVVSGSMEHDGSFNNWWAYQEDFYIQKNITKKEFLEFPFKNGFNKGDIMIVKGTKPEDLKIGDVIVFQAGLNYPVIHRIVKIHDEKSFYVETKGDHNRGQAKNYLFDETHITKEKIIGKAIFRIPYIGYLKIWFYELINKLMGVNLLKPASITMN